MVLAPDPPVLINTYGDRIKCENLELGLLGCQTPSQRTTVTQRNPYEEAFSVSGKVGAHSFPLPLSPSPLPAEA